MKFIIQGGKPLTGKITLAGAKNAVSKLMVASLLTDEPCMLENVPAIGDVEIVAELLRTIGSEIEIVNGTATVRTPEIMQSRVPELTRRNRIPILALGPLLSRAGEAEVPFLGGDRIGPRPVDLHLKALEALGAVIETRDHSYSAEAPHGLHGAHIKLEFPSVGATENTILAAVLAKGKTVLENAALEPEIMDLVKMLQNMGAIIELGAHRDFHIEGVEKLHGVTHRVLPDRNEAVSFACLAIATGGDILVRETKQDHLITFLNAVRRLGAEYEIKLEGIRFWKPRAELQPLDIETTYHPGFMSDWQQPFAVLLTQVPGESTIHETIYEDRFGYAEELNGLGAAITPLTECPADAPCRFNGKGFVHVAKIAGETTLHGGKLKVRDLRSGMVDVIAALVADGESEIEGVEEIDRGYEKIDERLRSLGAQIKRI